MKKNIIALAIASAIAAPVAFADAPTVYGKINVAIEDSEDNGTTTEDRDSRIGIKGSEDLGNGLKAVYKMEFGADVGDSFGGLSGRNAYVGLAGGFGTVLMGRHDSPFKMSQVKDLFGDNTFTDMGKKQVTGGLGLGGKSGELRLDNVVAYVSPSFSGVKLIAAAAGADVGEDAEIANAYSVALTYGSTKKGLYLAAAMDSADEVITEAVEVNGFDQEWTHTRFGAQYTTGGLIVNGTYQNFDADVDNSDEGTNVQVGVAYAMGKFMPKAKYFSTDYETSSMDDGTGYAVGLDYKLGKKTTAYVEYVSSEDMANADGEDDFTSASVGLIHKF
ncbi:MAG: porin [Pseudomonadota bacterium]|nr:porin [Pseudomonadota bacterium]